MSEFTPHPLPSGIIEENGRRKMIDAKGREVPIDLVKPQDQLMDEQVRKIAGYALALSDQLRRFKAHTFEDISDF
ncbi:MAG: sulfate transporter, partial [Alphaproteobacteria bacterium HGW-Alphaproteobacteria-8]